MVLGVRTTYSAFFLFEDFCVHNGHIRPTSFFYFSYFYKMNGLREEVIFTNVSFFFSVDGKFTGVEAT